MATKRKGREPERDKKKKRRKREESSSSSSSSDSETMRKAKRKKKNKKRSSGAGSIDISSQHSSKKRRKATDLEEMDSVLADQFSMQTVLNIKREKTSDDEMIKVSKEFSPRINRTVHTQEIISVNELHSDFVESNKKNVIIPDAVVKIEPPAIEVFQEASPPKNESERFSIESEHSNSTTSFASLRNSLSFEHNSNDSNTSAQSSDNNSLMNSESPCDNSTSSLKNDIEISPELIEESPVKKAAGHFESVAKSMHRDSNSMIESALGCGKDSLNIEHVDDVPKIAHFQPILSDVSDIITSCPKEIANTECSQEPIVCREENVAISQVPVTVVTEKPKSSGIGLITSKDIESNRRAVEEFDRLKREFEEFTRERLNLSNMSAERLAAAEELKRQFDMVENYDLPAVTKPVAVEMKVGFINVVLVFYTVLIE